MADSKGTPSFLTQNPVKVSPLIRGARWTFLIFGIFYGAKKRKYLAKREVGIRAEEAKLKKIRDAKLAEEKALQSEKDIQYLSDIFMGRSTG